ncbi:MAG: hypothetical protein FJ108_12340 [Deltaproteobacteria bacterium]|nr:hypothetical protein [Deltaproteobacteria bacterium]
MRFKIDENLPVEVLELLRGRGHDVLTVMDQRLGGAADSAVASACRTEQRTLVTLDLDFADIRAYPPTEYAGIVVLRLTRQDKRHVLEVIERVAALLARRSPDRSLWIVEDGRVRVRE